MDGELIGRGRHADVFADGPTRVRRRYRTGQDATPEAEVMRHVRSHGYPAPEVFDVDGPEMVMERVEGPSLLQAMVRHPQTMPARARLLAGLHERLHTITAPASFARPFGRGDTVVHMDLQPANVVVTVDGPVVLDWGFAGAGPPEAESAHTWLQLATSEVPGHAIERFFGWTGRRLFLRWFVGEFDRTTLAQVMDEVADYRLANRELTAGERERIARFRARPR